MCFKVVEGSEELVVGVPREFCHPQIPCGVVDHIRAIDRIDRNIVAHDIENHGLFCVCTFHKQFHLRAFWPAKVVENILCGYFRSRQGNCVGLNYSVAGQNPDLFSRTSCNHFHDSDRVVDNLERNANATERTFKIIVDRLKFGRRDIGGMWIEGSEKIR